jgi:hypothetical protein
LANAQNQVQPQYTHRLTLIPTFLTKIRETFELPLERSHLHCIS